MRTNVTGRICGVAVLLAATAIKARAELDSWPCWQQRQDPTTEAPEALDRALKEAGYAPTTDSLLAALHDPKWQVKGVAAARLAMAEGFSAIPPLLSAWAQEKDRCGKEGMRLALASLGKRWYDDKMARGGAAAAFPPPFQSCTASAPAILSLHLEPEPQSPGAAPAVRVTLRNVSGRPLAVVRLALAGAMFSTTVLDPSWHHAPMRKDVVLVMVAPYRVPPRWCRSCRTRRSRKHGRRASLSTQPPRELTASASAGPSTI